MTLCNWFANLLTAQREDRAADREKQRGGLWMGIFLLLALSVLWAVHHHQYQHVCGQVRLQIVAHSNTLADQRVKQRVSQAVLARLAQQGVRVTGSTPAGLPSNEQNHTVMARIAPGPSHPAAWKNQRLNPPVLSSAARQAVLRAGADYPVTITLGERDYPAKVLGGPLPRTVPAGRYLALQIYLGEGRGYNWWGVLYPPLCFGVKSGPEQSHAIVAPGSSKTRGVELRSYFWDKLQAWLAR